MIQIVPQLKIRLAYRPVDFRKGIDGLIALCRQELASDPYDGKTKEMRLAVAARYVPTSVELYGNMKETNRVYELGGSYSLDNYGAVLVSGRNEYTHNRIRTHTTKGVAFVNCNLR